MTKIERAIEALRNAVQDEIEAAYAAGKADAAKDAMATFAKAMGVEAPKKRGRPAKAK